jgi:hypothetical protein
MAAQPLGVWPDVFAHRPARRATAGAFMRSGRQRAALPEERRPPRIYRRLGPVSCAGSRGAQYRQ